MKKLNLKKVAMVVCFAVGVIFVGCNENDDDDNGNGTVNDKKWSQLTNFGGSEREGAVAFSINGKIYTGLGTYNDFWEYDPTTNKWVQKASFPSGTFNGNIINSVGFSIKNKGYVGLCNNDELWEYDPETDKWIQKANFPGGIRAKAVGFSSENRGYVGLGNGLKDFWE